MTIRTKAFSAIALAVSLTAGCSSHDDRHDRHDREHVRADERVEPVPVPVRPGEAYIVRGIPRDAIRLEKDEGPEMRVRPERDGRLYVYSPREERIVYEGRLHRHEEFVAIPDRDVMTIDGRRVDGPRLDRREHYQLYFRPD